MGNIPLMELLLILFVMMLIAILSYVLLTYFLSKTDISQKRLYQALDQSSRMLTQSDGKKMLRKQNAQENISPVIKDNKTYQAASMQDMLRQANLNLTSTQLMLYSVIFGTCLFFYLYLVVGMSLLLSIGIWVIGSFGLPRFLLRFLLKRRQKQFLAEFPNVLDLIVRGVKSGIPVNDSFQMIAVDGPEPIRSEMSKVLEKQIVGVPLADSILELYKAVPLTEVMFLAIVMQIQTESGGSLSGALTNLSSVLRNRSSMRGKVQALSQEAKASAAIIGMLPILVGVGLYFVSPGYLDILVIAPTGKLMLTISAIWMALGVVVMKKMINFDM